MIGKVAVAYSDGTRTVAVIGRPADLIAFEDKTGRSEPDRYSDFAFLVWRVEARDVEFATWIDTLDGLDSRPEVVERTLKIIDGGLPPETVMETVERAFSTNGAEPEDSVAEDPPTTPTAASGGG